MTFAVIGDAGRPRPDQPGVALRAVRALHGARRRPSPTSTSGGSRACSASGRTGSSTLFGRTVGELFLPAVVVPGIIFTALALWPFARGARPTGTRPRTTYAQRPREAPVRSGVGAAGITMFIVLMLAGSNDVLAKFLQIEVDTLNSVLRVLLFVLPVGGGAAHVLDLPRPGAPRRAADRAIRHGWRSDARPTAGSGPRTSRRRSGRRRRETARRPIRDRPRRRGRDRRTLRVLVLVRDAARRERAGARHLRPLAGLHDRRDRGGRDRVRVDRLVAAPVPAPALRRRRGARAPVPRPTCRSRSCTRRSRS